MHPLVKIREKILSQIRPTKPEIEQAYRVFSQIKEGIEQISYKEKLKPAFIQLEGSAGRKQTQLRNSRELDIFIGLSPSILPKNWQSLRHDQLGLAKLLQKLVRSITVKAAQKVGAKNIQIAFAEHPYVSAILDGYKVELVFSFNLSEEIILKRGPLTAVDRTPLHSLFVDKHLTKHQRDDVRLLKAFLQAQFVYGDASPIGRSGFTGFSAEMLIYHFRTLVKALNGLENLIDNPLDYFTRPPEEVKQQFQNDQLIIVDPTDSKRNVAASISLRAYRYAQHQTTKVLSKPSPDFFLPREIPTFQSPKEKNVKHDYFVIEFTDRTGWHYTKTRDKLYKFFTRLCRFIKHESTGEPRFGRCVFEEVFRDQSFAIALQVEMPKISENYWRIGPPLHLKKAVAQFREKHPTANIVNGRLQVKIHRTFNTAEMAIQHFLTKHSIDPNLQVTGFSNQGKAKIGQQALWILDNAVIPHLETETK